MIRVARVLFLIKLSDERGSEPVDLAFIQCMEFTEPLHEADEKEVVCTYDAVLIMKYNTPLRLQWTQKHPKGLGWKHASKWNCLTVTKEQ